MTLGCKDKGIKKSEFVTKTQFLSYRRFAGWSLELGLRLFKWGIPWDYADSLFKIKNLQDQPGKKKN